MIFFIFLIMLFNFLILIYFLIFIVTLDSLYCLSYDITNIGSILPITLDLDHYAVISLVPPLLDKSTKDSLIKKDYSTIYNSLDSKFKEWFVGLSDAEGCFSVYLEKKGNSVNLTYELLLHIDELPLIHKLHSILQCGKIYSDIKYLRCRYLIREKKAINELLIPIFF